MKKSFGECLAEARQYRNLTQPQLLMKMGLKSDYPAMISAHENDKKNPEVQTLQRYADALEIVLSYRANEGWSWRPK